jgi:antagonist of KipI
MRVLASGLLTTVQDLGRYGFAKDGVPPCGAMDPNALRAANLLVGNDEDAAGLEITVHGPALEVNRSVIAVCGADLSPHVSRLELPLWEAVYVQEGATLEFGDLRWGCRTYVAVAGGIDVPPVMGSRSTYLWAALGGFGGRAVRAGDVLPIGEAGARARRIMGTAAQALGPVPFARTDRRLGDPQRLYRSGAIRVVRGPHWDMIASCDREALLNASFRVSARSDRMGYRLDGPRLRAPQGGELLSSAVLTGTVQVPPGGQPIVLMSDRQTTGGYPMVAQVVRADLGTIAQLKPGDEIRFVETTIDEAQRAMGEVEAILDELREVEDHASSRP